MNPFLDIKLIDATEPQKLKMREWMAQDSANRFRLHLQGMIAFHGNEAVKQALDSEEMPGRKPLSEDHLAKAARFHAALTIWEEMQDGQHVTVKASLVAGIAEV